MLFCFKYPPTQTPNQIHMAITAATPFQSYEDMLKRAENQYKNYGCYELAEGNIQTMDDLMAKFNSQATWQNVYNTLLTGAKLHLDFCATPKEVFIDHRISGTVHTFAITISNCALSKGSGVGNALMYSGSAKSRRHLVFKMARASMAVRLA